jgi:chaperonin GroES
MTWKPTKPVALEKLISAVNICDLLEKEDLTTLGNTVMAGYQQDVQSRKDWEKRQANANKLALQVMEAKTDPWPNAANIKFPLVTVAAMQFQARAYPTLFSGVDLVKVRVIGEDNTGEKKGRAERIATHMSWQNLEQDPAWEEDSDKLCLVVPIAGCAFRKRVFEPGPQRQVSQIVLPRNLVVNYWTRSLDDSPRFTHTFYLNANNIRQRELDGRYRELSHEPGETVYQDGTTRDAPVRPDPIAGEDEIQAAKDQRQGINKPEADNVTPWFTGEQYCWFDLDGDGYEEPYIVTFDIGANVVRRVVARYRPSQVVFTGGEKLSDFADSEGNYKLPDDKVYKITPVRIFTKYGFIPSPDGGFYDLGLGTLLGPLNSTVNSIINQMLDQGTMYTLGGGFLGRAFKGRGGPITFAPNQWHTLDVTSGDDLRKNVLPNPIREPSGTLLQLLGLIIQYAERIVQANDVQMGEQDMQNQKAETTRILNENGQRVYNGIYKRMWRASKYEYRVQYDLNAMFLEQDIDFEDLTSGRSALIRPDDYVGSSLDVRPAADPHIVSDGEAQKMAAMVVQRAQMAPGYNRYRSELRFLKSMRVPNIEEIYPPPKDPQSGKELPDYPPPPNPKLLAVQQKGEELKLKQAEFQTEQRKDQTRLLLEVRESMARVEEMKAMTVKLLAEADAAKAEPIIKMIYAQIESEGKRQDSLLKAVELIDKRMESMNGAASKDSGAESNSGMAESQGGAAVPGLSAMVKPNGAGPHGGVVAGGI